MLIRPATPKTKTVATLSVAGATVFVRFPEYRDDFRRLLKGLGFHWNYPSKCWQREIGERAGDPMHRCAEIGRILVEAEYCIEFADSAIQDMMLSSSFEPECKRWVMATKSGWFKIWWGKGEDCYAIARRITASRYASPCVVVPPEHFAEVMDFAEIHGFRFTEAAQRIVDQARQREGEALLDWLYADKGFEWAIAKDFHRKIDLPNLCNRPPEVWAMGTEDQRPEFRRLLLEAPKEK